jgi:hypothetical protein
VSSRLVGPRFEVVARSRPFELVSPGFVAASAEPAAYDGLVGSAWSPPAPYAAVEVTVEHGRGTLLAGLSAEGGDHLVAFHDVASGRVGLEMRTGGMTTVLASRRLRRRVRRLAFVLCENQPTVLVDTGRGWRPVATDRHRVALRADFRVPATLARFTAVWGSRSGTSDLGPVRVGLFGMAGLRDLHLVQHADGSPYVRDGRMFLTATCAGLGFFRQAHWGVFALDPAELASRLGASDGSDGADSRDVLRLEQTAQLFSRRDGLLLGDHAGQLVRDGDRWLVAVSSWGDFAPHRGVYVRQATTTDDLLDGVHVLDTEPVRMPTDRGSYDPGMTLIDGRWHVSYVESVSHQPSRFHPALAVGPAGAAHWTEGLERVGETPELAFCEGPIIARPDGPAGPDGLDGEWRVLASDGRARRYRVFDLAMRRLGDLDAPYGTNLPHPQIFDLPDGQRVMVTFDGTPYAKRVLGYGTHGDVVVMRAT